MPHDKNDLSPQHSSAILQAADEFRRNYISRNSSNEDVADTLIKDEFNRYSRICAFSPVS